MLLQRGNHDKEEMVHFSCRFFQQLGPKQHNQKEEKSVYMVFIFNSLFRKIYHMFFHARTSLHLFHQNATFLWSEISMYLLPIIFYALSKLVHGSCDWNNCFPLVIVSYWIFEKLTSSTSPIFDLQQLHQIINTYCQSSWCFIWDIKLKVLCVYAPMSLYCIFTC